MVRDNGINYMESLSSIELNNIFNNKYRGNTPLVLYANGGSWDKLSMRERYNYIHNNYDILANGGTLDDIKRRFAEGGEKEGFFLKLRTKAEEALIKAGYGAAVSILDRLPKDKRLDIMYRIMSQGSSNGTKEDRDWSDIIKAIQDSYNEVPISNDRYTGSWRWGKDEKGFIKLEPNTERDLNLLFAKGNVKGLYTEIPSEEIRGVDPHPEAPTYYGSFVPNESFTISTEFEPLLQYLADNNMGAPIWNGTNPKSIELPLSDKEVGESQDRGFTVDNVGNFIPIIGRDKEGNPEMLFYDYNNYGEEYSNLHGSNRIKSAILGMLLDHYGTPVNLRQYVPINVVSPEEVWSLPEDLRESIEQMNEGIMNVAEANNVMTYDPRDNTFSPIREVLPEVEITKLKALEEKWKDRRESNNVIDKRGQTFLVDNEFKSGGSIHIKPENRGKFTALKKRTGHSASWFKAHGTPAQRKMATFALNARKWKHGDGGNLFFDGGTQASDNTRVDLGIVPNLPVDDSIESKFYRDLAFLGVETEEERKTQEFRDRATNQGAYQHTVAPTDVEARTGWMEVNPLTGDVTPHAATTVSAAPLTKGQRMWRSPAFQLALAPMFDGPFMLANAGRTAKVAQGATNVRRAYSTPRADIMPVEDRIVTNSMPTITAENAASITPAQWTAAQDAAIARGDMVEAQRLADLHATVVKPDNPVNGVVFAHSGDTNYNIFDASHFGETDEGYHGMGFYFSNTRIPENLSIYKVTAGPHGEIPTMNYGPIKKYYYLYGDEIVPGGNPETNFFDTDKIAIVSRRNFDKGKPTEIIVGKPNHIKSADAVTYDDFGRRIPLGDRHNLFNPDTRWGWLPWTIGGGAVGYDYLNQDEGPIVAFANGGHLYDGESEDSQQLFIEPVETEYPKNGESPDMAWHKWWLNNRADKVGENIKYTETHPIWALQELTGINFPGFAAIGKERIPELLNNASKYKEYTGGYRDIPQEVWKDWRNSFPSQLDMSDDDFDYLSSVGNVLGQTSPRLKYIYYPNPDLYTIDHERTHALGITPMTRVINRYKNKLKDGVERDYYYDDGEEIYARLSAFRAKHNINPNHVITKDDLQVLKSIANSEEGNGHSYLFDRYNDDFLLFLFNDVANTGTLQDFREQFANQAALGGPLVEYAMGGHLFDGEEEETQRLNNTSGFYNYDRDKGVIQLPWNTPLRQRMADRREAEIIDLRLNRPTFTDWIKELPASFISDFTASDDYVPEILKTDRMKYIDHLNSKYNLLGEKRIRYSDAPDAQRERGRRPWTKEVGFDKKFDIGGKLFGDGGLEQNELSIGNIGFFNHPLLSLKYYGSPLYDLETPFTVAFTDAIIKDKDDFMWNGKMYSTDIDWNKKFEKDANGNIPFQEFANYMYPAVIKILKEKGLPLTNAHNIVRLAGLESLYGTNPVSGKGYNLSGIKWNSKTMGNYNHATNSKDNLEYVDFDNLKDYLEFKIDLLNNRYDAINAENDKDFVDRLHLKSSGINKKGFDYSTNYKGYLNMLLNTKSLDKWLKLLYTPVVTQQSNL